MNLVRIEFTAEDLPPDVMGFTTIRDQMMLFVWNRGVIQEIMANGDIDLMCATATLMVAEAMHGDAPVRLSSVS